MTTTTQTLYRAIISGDIPAANEAFKAVMQAKTQQVITREYAETAKTFLAPPKK